MYDEPIPIVVYRFVSEMNRYKTPLGNFKVWADSESETVYFHLISTNPKFNYQYRTEWTFYYVMSWSNTKALEMAFLLLMDISYEIMKSCLAESRKEKS